MFSFNINTIFIAVSCIVSFIGFSNQKLIDDLIFYPPAISKDKEWYRFITCGFIHADVPHLAFNMYSLYMFGNIIEIYFTSIFYEKGKLFFCLLYITALIVCLLPTYFKNQDNYYYRSLGASGAVSAIVFSFIFISPTTKLGLILIPGLKAPAFIFGILYLGVSAYLAKKGDTRINHSAHLWGGVYGIVFLILASKLFSSFDPIKHFITEIKYYFE